MAYYDPQKDDYLPVFAHGEQVQLAKETRIIGAVKPEDMRLIVMQLYARKWACLKDLSPIYQKIQRKKKKDPDFCMLEQALLYMDKDAEREFLGDLDGTSNILLWGERRQVIKPSANTLEKWAKSPTATLTSNCFKNLLENPFYVDITKSEWLCSELRCKGIFVYLHNIGGKYTVHSCRLGIDEYSGEILFANAIYPYDNADKGIIAEDIRETTDMQEEYRDGSDYKERDVTLNNRVFEMFLLQLLLHLASGEFELKKI